MNVVRVWNVYRNKYDGCINLLIIHFQVMSAPFGGGTMGGGTVEETPLAHACSRGFLEIARLLVHMGANVNYLCSVSPAIKMLGYGSFYFLSSQGKLD